MRQICQKFDIFRVQDQFSYLYIILGERLLFATFQFKLIFEMFFSKNVSNFLWLFLKLSHKTSDYPLGRLLWVKWISLVTVWNSKTVSTLPLMGDQVMFIIKTFFTNFTWKSFFCLLFTFLKLGRSWFNEIFEEIGVMWIFMSLYR